VKGNAMHTIEIRAALLARVAHLRARGNVYASFDPLAACTAASSTRQAA